jgi:microcin C transport system substrate-binding protein
LAITRRHFLQSGAFAAIAPALGAATVLPSVSPAAAQTASGEPAWRHALSLFGDIKYPADFKRFDYVNPDAPRGGVARMISIGTFDNFNTAVMGVNRAGGHLDLRNANDAVTGRGRNRVWLARRERRTPR